MNQSHIDKGLVGLVGLVIAASVPAATAAGELGAEHTLQVGETLSVRPHLEYRPRVLTHTGRDMKANGQKASVTQRVRLGVGATLLDTVHVRVDAQDVRTWGEELSTLGDRRPDGPEIYQAYGELRLFEGSVVRVGRQEIKIDEGRLFWHRDWNDHAQSFDAVRVDQGIGQLKLTGLWSRVSEDDVYEVDANGNALRGAPGDHDVVAAHARSEHLSWLRPSAVFVYDRDGSNEAECYVVGVFVDGEVLPGLSYRTELYHQSGQRPYGAANTMGYYQRADVSAFMFSARADYKVPAAFGLKLRGAVDVYTGDDPDTETNETFEVLYGARRAFLGDLNIFRSIGKDTAGGGIVDAQGQVSAKPVEGLSLSVAYHHFSSVEPVQDAQNLGDEVDLRVKYEVSSFLQLMAGGGLYLPGRAMKCGKGDCDMNATNEVQTYVMARAFY